MLFVYCVVKRITFQTDALPAAGLRSVTIHRALIGRLYQFSCVATSLTGVPPVTAADVDKCWTVDTRHLTVTFNE